MTASRAWDFDESHARTNDSAGDPSPRRRAQPPAVALQRWAGNRALNTLLRGSGGRPLDVATREPMERLLGEPLSTVRFHADEGAAEIVDALGALAVTRGEHIYFARGEYSPHSGQGRTLISHELAHVLQQRGPLGHTVSRGTAEAEAASIAAGEAVPTVGSVPAGAVQLAAGPRGRERYPDLPWGDFAKAYSMLTAEQQRQLDYEEGTPLRLQAEEAEQLQPSEETSVMERIHEGAGAVGSSLTGLATLNALRDIRPSRLGSELATDAAERKRSFREIADELDAADDPDRVAYAFMRSPLLESPLLLQQMAASPEGRHLLDRLHAYITAGATGPIEGFLRGMSPLPLADDTRKRMQMASRIMDARVGAVSPEKWRAATPENVKIFPYMPQGLTTFGQTPMDVEVTPEGNVRVQVSGRVPGKYPNEWKTLPQNIATQAYEIPGDEIIAIRRYDQGGNLQVVPAIYLAQLDAEYLVDTAGKVQAVAGLGAAVGGGGLSTAGKTGVAATLVRADQEIVALSAVTMLVNENRYWLQEEDYGGFLDALDFVNGFAQIYGYGRLAASAPEMLRDLHESHANWKARRSLMNEPLPPEKAAVLQQIEQQMGALPKPPPDEKLPARPPNVAKPKIPVMLMDPIEVKGRVETEVQQGPAAAGRAGERRQQIETPTDPSRPGVVNAKGQLAPPAESTPSTASSQPSPTPTDREAGVGQGPRPKPSLAELGSGQTLAPTPDAPTPGTTSAGLEPPVADVPSTAKAAAPPAPAPAPPTVEKPWDAPDLTPDEVLEAYRKAGVKDPLSAKKVRAKAKEGYRFDPNTRRWTKPNRPVKLPGVEQEAGRLQERVFQAITGWPKNTSKQKTKFGQHIPDYMVKRDPVSGEWVTAKSPSDAQVIADSKYYDATVVPLDDQIKAFVEMTARTNVPGQRTLLLMTNENARIADAVVTYASKRGVAVRQIKQRLSR
jgi:Domain of unknown function (DUF4157)